MKTFSILMTFINWAYAQNKTFYSIEEKEQIDVNKENFFEASPLYTSLAVGSLSLSLITGSFIIYYKNNKKNKKNIYLEHPVINETFEL